MEQSSGEHLLYLIHERVGESIGETEAMHLIGQLRERDLLSMEGAQLMVSAISQRALSLPIPAPLKDAARARILRSMLLTLAQQRHRMEPK
jgi:transcriptional regulator CtsR